MDYLTIAGYCLFAFIIYTLLDYLQHLWSLRSYPPGPFPLPFFGNLLDFDQFSTKLEEKYGNVYSVSFCMERVVVISTVEPALEALVEKAGLFSDRPTKNYPFNVMTNNRNGLVLLNFGDEWAAKRKFVTTALKKVCSVNNNTKVEELATKHAINMMKRFEKKMDEPIELNMEIRKVILSVMLDLLFGECYNTDETDFNNMLRALICITEVIHHGHAVQYFPFLRFFPVQSMNSAYEHRNLVDGYLEKKYKDHKKNAETANENIFAYFMKASMDEEFLNQFNLKDLVKDTVRGLMSELLVSSIDTSNTSTSFLMTRVLNEPQYIDDVLEELNEVVGINKYPQLSHRSSLPKCMAIIQESLRLSSGPYSLQHVAKQDQTIGGHPIPKGSQVIFRKYLIHRDPRYMKDPERFIPYRWLDENGKFCPNKYKNFMAFSFGKRACFGESIARSTIFLLFTRMLVHFKISPDPNKRLPKITDSTIGLSFICPPFNIFLEKR